MRDFTDQLDERLRPLATDFSHESERFRSSFEEVFAVAPAQRAEAAAASSGAPSGPETVERSVAPDADGSADARSRADAPGPAATVVPDTGRSCNASREAVTTSAPSHPAARVRRGRATSPSRPVAGSRRRFHPSRVAVAGASGVVATIASVAVLTGTSAAGLPILETKTSDASAAADAPALRAAGVDLRRGHAFRTANGPGYVLASPDGGRLCLTAPDSSPDRTYSGTCAPRAAVERRGLTLQITRDRSRDPDATNLVVVLLPEGATSPRLTGTQGASVPRLQAGVFTAALREPAALTFQAGAATRQLRFQGPFDGASISCDGKAVPAPAAASDRTSATGDQLTACPG